MSACIEPDRCDTAQHHRGSPATVVPGSGSGAAKLAEAISASPSPLPVVLPKAEPPYAARPGGRQRTAVSLPKIQILYFLEVFGRLCVVYHEGSPPLSGRGLVGIGW